MRRLLIGLACLFVVAGGAGVVAAQGPLVTTQNVVSPDQCASPMASPEASPAASPSASPSLALASTPVSIGTPIASPSVPIELTGCATPAP